MIEFGYLRAVRILISIRFIEVTDNEMKMIVEKINTIQDLLIDGEVKPLYELLGL